MSRLDELKKQYPELNLSFFDLFVRLDKSKSYKYLPVFCKIFGKRFNVKEHYPHEEKDNMVETIKKYLDEKGVQSDDLSPNSRLFLQSLFEFYPLEYFSTMKDFMFYMEKNQIDNKDVTSYASIDDVRKSVSLASIKEFTKELESQIIKEFEDETWVAVRPLTFAASAKYGASTRWCTTYQKEKNYFERYWRNGVLVYFINKQTGYKFAGYKELSGGNEISFWNAEDNRVDLLNLEIDDYMFTVLKNIFKSEQTNKNLSSDEIQVQVHIECIADYQKMEAVHAIEPIEVEEPRNIENTRGLLRRYINEQLRNEQPDEGPEEEMMVMAEGLRDVLQEATNEMMTPTMRA